MTRSRKGLALILVIVAVGQVGVVLPRGPERIGDGLQIALPVLGLACAGVRQGATDYLVRLVGLQTVVHGLKRGLGDARINRRPNGSSGGFPSGHTSAAAYGASHLARSCAPLVPYVGPVVALAAGYVGVSRVESGNHDSGQVAVGAGLGMAWDVSGRGRGRRALRAAWRWLRSTASFAPRARPAR